MTELNSSMHSKFSEAVIARLRSRKIITLIEFLDEDNQRLMNFTELCYKDIIELKEYILSTFGGVIQKPSELLEMEQKNIICTSVKSLDNILDGGLYPGQVYELCGIPSSGKTQLCLTIAGTVAMQYNCIVRYVDTKRDFFASRIQEILTTKFCDDEAIVINDIMNNIKVSCVYNMHQLFKVLRHFVHILQSEQNDVKTKVIIIDSLPAVIFKFWNDHDTISTLTQFSNIIRYIAARFQLPIIITNLIRQWVPTTTDQSISKMTGTNMTIMPLLGKYWLHVPSTRLLLEKRSNVDRKITVWKSFQLKVGTSCNIQISNAGVT